MVRVTSKTPYHPNPRLQPPPYQPSQLQPPPYTPSKNTSSPPTTTPTNSTNSKDLRNTLLQKTHYAFDLDDTLHSYTHASHTAITSTLSLISSTYSLLLPELQKVYTDILKASTATAFTSGRTSHEYRRERFAGLLREFGVFCKEGGEFMTKLLKTYETAFINALELKEGAMKLIIWLKENGKRVGTITESPQDAAERTLATLKLSDQIDFLATSNAYGVAKTEGLFSEVIKRLGIEAGEMVVVGDSWERDVLPAVEAGVGVVVYVKEGEGGEEGNWGGRVVRVGGLAELGGLLVDSHGADV